MYLNSNVYATNRFNLLLVNTGFMCFNIFNPKDGYFVLLQKLDLLILQNIL